MKEHATSSRRQVASSADAKASGNTSRWFSGALMAVVVAAFGGPFNSFAQSVPVAGTSTRMDQAGNGVPVVQIATPNGAGVSHNQFTQYNVGTEGQILNNSRDTVQTQLGGYILGNTNLQPNQPARIILNEVVSTNPSQLNGYMEVAGPSAEVIVANPNGIFCSGCGFINTTRGTLTTGTPIFGGDGSLSAFQVDRGLIAINGNGFSTSDRVDLLARAIQVNAGLWAKDINVITGANRIGYTDLATQTIAGSGTTPAFALDVSALGGMYASKIKLVGTEAGVGVRSAGELVATGGDFTLTNNGDVQLTGRTAAAGNVTINAAGNAALTGRNYAQGTLSATGNAVTLGGDTWAGQALAANSRSNLSVSGTTQANTVALDAVGNTALAGQVQSTQDTTLHTGGTLTNAAQAYAGGNLALSANDLVQAQGAQLAAQGRLDAQVRNTIDNGGALIGNRGTSVSAATLNNRGQLYGGTDARIAVSGTATNSGLIGAGQLLTVNAGALTQSATGELSSGGDAGLSVGGRMDNAGRMLADGTLTTSSASVTNTGTISATNAALATGALSNAGAIQATQALTLNALNRIDNAAGATLAAGQQLTAHTTTLANAGQLVSDGNVTVTATAIDNANRLEAGQRLSVTTNTLTQSATGIALGTSVDINASGAVANAGRVHAINDLSLRGGVITNAGVVYGGTQVTVVTPGALTNTTTIASDGALTVQAQSLDNTASGAISSADALTVQVQQAAINAGQLYAQRTLQLSAGSLNNAGATYSGGPATVTVLGAAANSGSLTAAQALTVNAGSLTNSGELGSATSSVTLTTSGDLSFTGRTIAAGQLTANSGGALNVAGQTFGATGVALSANGNLTTAGTIDSTGAVALHSGATLSNAAKVVTAGDVDLQATAALTNTADIQAANIRAQARTLDNSGRLLASNNVSATGTQSSRNTGIVVAGLQPDGTVGLSGTATLSTDGTLTQAGTVLAGETIHLSGNTLALAGGQVASNGDLSLTSVADIDNTGSTLSARDTLSLTTQGAIKNAQGQLSGAQVQIAASSLDNTAGTLVQTGTAPFALNLSGALTNTNGRIAANADTFTVSAGSLDNTGGRIEHAGTGTATVTSGASLTNTNGLIVSNGALTTAATGTLINTGGTISGVGTTDVSANALNNADGVIAGSGNVRVTSTNALDNRNGAIVQRGTGTLTVQAGSLANTGTGSLIGAEGTATVTATTDLDNRGGTLFAQNGLTATAGGNLTNTAGAIQSGGALTLGAGGTLDNTTGQINAAGTTAITANAVTNTGGRIVNSSTGATTIQVATALDNRGGTLGSTAGAVAITAGSLDNSSDGTNGGRVIAGSDLTLNSDSINNASGLLYAQHDLSYANTSGTIDNTGGQIGAGNAATITADALTNTDGKLTANTVDLTLNRLENTRGEIAGTQRLGATLGSLTGTGGRLFGGQEADIHLLGDYTHQDQQLLQSNGLLALTVDGTLTNAGTLESQGALAIDANAVVNTATGVLNSSNVSNTGVTQVTATTLTNAGRIEGDGIALTANDVTNTGTVIGSRVWIEADRLTNGRDLGTAIPATPYTEGFIGATESVDLRVSERVDNLDAEIYSLGDISIAGRAAGTRTGTVLNRSGRISAEGNVAIAADSIVNDRRLIELQQRTLAAGEYDRQSPQTVVAAVDDASRAALSAEYNRIAQSKFGHTAELIRNPSALVWAVDDFQTETTLARASADSQIKAGGDIVLDATQAVTNRASTIAAGQNVLINGNAYAAGGADVNNIAIVGTREGTRTDWAWIRRADQVDPSPYGHYWNSGRWVNDYPEFAAQTGTSALSESAGTLLSSSITAGQAVVIDAHNVTNAGVTSVSGPTAVAPTSGWAGTAPTAPTLGSGTTVAAVTGGGTNTGTVGGLAAGPTAGTVGTSTGGTPITVPTTGGTTPPAQVIGTPGNPLPNLVPPTGQLYTRNPNGRYLIETDPRFANYGTWLGSDYLLGKLGYSPDGQLKRLGDDFYETQLVLQQITGLTGRKYLAESNGLDQYRALMDAGAQVASTFGLSIGIGLTPEQIAALDQDIVWLVEMIVEGQKVLVPVVYLSQASANKYRLDGAVISAQTVAINATGTLANGGTIAASGDLSLTAQDLLNQGGAITAGGVAYLSALNDVINRNGTITGGQVAISAGRDLISETKITGLNTPVAGITSQGDLSLSAGRDLSLIGTSVSAQGNAALNAGRDLTLANANNALGSHGVLAPAARTTMTVGGNLGMSAGRDLSVQQSSATAGGNLVATAGRDLSVTSAAGPIQSVTDASQQTRRTSSGGTQQNLDAASLSAGNNLVLSAGQDVNLTAAQLDAGNAMAVVAGRDINSTTVTTTDTTLNAQQGKKSSKTEFTSDQTVHGTQFNASGDIAMQAGQDINLQSATAVSDTGGIGMSAGRDVNLTAVQEEHTTQLDTSTKKSGTFSSTKTTTHDKVTDSVSLGTVLNGDVVEIGAGGDFSAVDAQITGTHGVTIAAEGNLTLGAGESTRTETHTTAVKKSGISGNGSQGGIGFTAGTSKQTTTFNGVYTDQSSNGTVVGSTEGNVVLQAGGEYRQVGSDVIAGKAPTDEEGATGNIFVKAESITIAPGVNTRSTTSTVTSQQKGVGMSLVGTPLDSYRNVQQTQANTDGYQQTKGVITEIAAAGATAPQVAITYSNQQSNSRTDTSSVQHHGSNLIADGGLTLLATGSGTDADGKVVGGTVTVTGSSLIAGGAVTVAAPGDITFGTSTDYQQQTSESSQQGKRISTAVATPGDTIRHMEGTPNSGGVSASPYGSLDQRGASLGTVTGQTPTQVIGDSIQVVTTQGDIAIEGSAFTATNDLTLDAKRGAVTIVPGQTGETFSSNYQRHQVGDLGGTGTTNTVGVRDDSGATEATLTQQSTMRSSLVAGGNLTATAGGGALTVQGSDMAAGRNLTLIGQSVILPAGQDAESLVQTQQSSQAGITLSMSGYAVDAAKSFDQAMVAREAGDNRMANLYAAQAATTVATNVNSNSAAVKATVSVGKSSGSSEFTTAVTQTQGTTLTAGETLTVIATGGGEGPNDGDIVGEGVQATGKNVNVIAKNEIELGSATSTSTEQSSNKSSSASVGVGFGLGGSQNGFTIELAAAGSKGRATGNGTTYQGSQITATDTAKLISGGSTSLEGRVVADTIVADIKGDLQITTPQDSNEYHSQQDSFGFNASICVPPICYGTTVTGSASVGNDNIDSSFRSTGQQSGLFAGAGGYHVDVVGNADLTGAVIASTADANKNSLTTGTITVSDLTNSASYDVDHDSTSVSYSGGTSTAGTDAAAGGVSFGGGNAQLLSNLAQNAAGNALSNAGQQPNGQTSRTTGSAISPGTITITNSEGQQALTGQTPDEAIAAIARDPAGTDGAIQPIFDLQRIQREQEMNRLYADIASQLAPALYNQVGNALDGQPTAVKVLVHGLIGGLVSQALGGDFADGAAGAALAKLAVETFGEKILAIEGLSEQDKRALVELMGLVVAGVTVQVAGGDSGTVNAAGWVGHTATVNNYLNHSERMKYLDAVLGCANGDEAKCTLKKELEATSNQRNDVLKSACEGARNTDACRMALADLERARQTYNETEYWTWIKDNAEALRTAAQVDEDLLRALVTHTSSLDATWKADCAYLGGCARYQATAGWVLRAMLGSDQELRAKAVEVIARHETMRALANGTGQVMGTGGRVVDTVTGLAELIVKANPVIQMKDAVLQAQEAYDYVQAHGFEAWVAREKQKTTETVSALWKSFTGYLGDAWEATEAKLLGGNEWDYYDVFAHGMTEGEVGFDVLTTFFGPELLLAKGGTVASVAGKVDNVATKVDNIVDDVAKVASAPPVPPGYKTLDSLSAAANNTGGLPMGYRRLVDPDGEIVVQGPDGAIYATEEAAITAAKLDDYIDILSPEARQHILYGDGPGSGGHLWPGQGGKTAFPETWSADKIIHEVGEIATNPSTRWYAQTGNGGLYTAAGKPATWVAYEIRDGVRIRVVYQPATGKVITAFPDNSPMPNYKPIGGG